MWRNVEKLAPLTGKNPVPDRKADKLHYQPRKFEVAELTPQESELVRPRSREGMPGAYESPGDGNAQMERRKMQELGGGFAAKIEVLRVHAASDLILKDNYLGPAEWSPLIYNFRHYFRLAESRVG
jgi:hypothetical protein